jgi:hypothetical protein
MMQWTVLQYLEAGAYVAIMVAVIGVPQMLSSYFDLRSRREADARAEASAERRHQDAERRHQEMMAMLAGVLANGRSNGPDQSELIRTLQQVIEDLRAENARLRNQRSNGSGGQ